MATALAALALMPVGAASADNPIYPAALPAGYVSAPPSSSWKISSDLHSTSASMPGNEPGTIGFSLGSDTSTWRTLGTRSDQSVTEPNASEDGYAFPLSVNIVSTNIVNGDLFNPAVLNCLGDATAVGVRKECYTYTATVTFPRPEINPVVTFGSGHGTIANDSMGCHSTWAELAFTKINDAAPAPGQVNVLSSIQLNSRDGIWSAASPSFTNNRLSYPQPFVASHPDCGVDNNPPLTTLQVNGLVSSITFAMPVMSQITKTLLLPLVAPRIDPNITFGFSFPSADLSMAKTATTAVDGNGTIDWRLTVANAAGNSDSHGFVIRDAVPAGVTNPKIVSAPVGCSLSGNDLVCALAPPDYSVAPNPTAPTLSDLTGSDTVRRVPSALRAGESVTIELSGTAPLSSADGIVNTATVSGTDVDPKTSNNTDTARTEITPSTWTLRKTATVDGATPQGGVVQPGDVITYTVTATATHGPVPHIVVSDDLSGVVNHAHFIPGSAELRVGDNPPAAIADPTAADPTRLITPEFSLEGGERAVLTYQVQVDADAWSATLKNLVTGSADVPLTDCSPCTTTSVTGAHLYVQKNGEGTDGNVVPVAGSAFRLLADDDGKPGAPLGVPVSPVSSETGRFDISGLMPGTYWLDETKAPEGHSLLARPAAFTIDSSGKVALVNAASDPNVTVVGDVLTVHDAKAVSLPFTGGVGFGLVAGLGATVLAAAIAAAVLIRRRTPRTA
jgi:hypothetical protein